MVTAARLLLVIFLLVPFFANGTPLEQARITNAEQDSTGRIWASTESSARPLLLYDNGEWKNVNWRLDVREKVTATPQMARGAAGKVVILWRRDQRYWLTEHGLDGSRWMASWEKELFFPALFVDSRGDAWITHRQTEIFRVKRAGSPIEWVGSLNPRGFVVADGKGTRRRHLNTVRTFEDGRGIVWFWTDGRFSSGKSLSGLTAFEGGKLSEPEFKNLPQGECYFATLEDPSHALVALKTFGLFRLDLVAREATPVPEPFPKAFLQITQIIMDHGREYVVARATNANNAAENNLWLFHEWKEPRKLSDKIEFRNEPLPGLPVPNGVVLGSSRDGLLFFPDDGAEPQNLNWKSDFPLANVDILLPLEKERLWAGSWHHGSAAVTFPPWQKNQNNFAAEVTLLYAPPIQDHKRGRLWAITGQEQELQEWDGQKWELHPAPKHRHALTELSIDNHDRIWGFTYAETLLWDPATKQWRVFNDVYDALGAILPNDRAFSWRANNRWNVVFSGDGRAALWSDAPNNLNYFDGLQWKRWPKAAVADGPLHFDGKGRLSITRNLQVQSLEGENWITSEQKAEPKSSEKPPPRYSYHLGGRNPGYVDEEGVTWFTRDHRLYRRRGSLEVAVFKSDEINPFSDGRTIQNVTLDGHGNAFLCTNHRLECVLVKPNPPLPETTMKVAVNEDITRIQLAAVGPHKHWFQWRLDGADWCDPSEDDHIELQPLANGQYRFEARAMDERLQLDPTPATAVFKVAVDGQQQINRALAELESSEGAAREKAVRTLVRHSQFALPLLRERRVKARDDERWWIDATIQEIERASSQLPKTPGNSP